MNSKPIGRKLRRTVTERAKGCCEYCKSQQIFAMQNLSVEHIIPIAKKGTNSSDNLALACQGCNNYKHTKTQGLDPVTLEITNLYHPRQQKWEDHFTWNYDYCEIIGLTPTGRVTVELLKLNREGVVNLRRILYAAGNHPPL
ncbi:HNH nuclease domain-containing protein [Tumidithrix helvetica PCC 7403]|uniref:HNH endonuclease n=1 Tax=Tumidithrix helvetica TaxID=3457545 RepID=UPI003CA8EABF